MLPAQNAPRPVRVLLALLAAVFFLHVLDQATGVLGPLLDGTAGEVVYHALLAGPALLCILRGLRPDGRPWTLLGIALLLWTAGDVLWMVTLADRADPPFPSLADALWLGFYPPAFVAVVMLARRSAPHLDRRLWLDGLIGGLAAGSLGALLAFDAVMSQTEGSAAAIAANLAYPLVDIVLLGLVVGVLVAARGRGGAPWLWLAAGIGCFAVADSAYLWLVATGAYSDGHVVDLGWIAAAVLIGHAAWQPQPRVASRTALHDTDTGVGVPLSLAGLAAVLLALSDVEANHALGLVLALAALGAVLLRLRLTHLDLRANLVAIRRQALTDALTGLPNRAALLSDIDGSIADQQGAVLALFDLDGFKAYNDTFGHLAGDDLLHRVASRLQEEAAEHGACAYRMGGDEFCVLGRLAADGVAPLMARLGASLAEQGEGFSISASGGYALIPDEAATPSAALGLADTRMYTVKRSGRVQPTSHVKEVLMAALAARDQDLASHMHHVAAMARAVAIELGLPDQEVEQVTIAAELHDIGKVAIPDAVLNKPGRLTEEEWRFMRRHTIIGERILSAAPSLQPVSRLVRSAHERFDGAGYPDGLAGADIPVGSHVIFVCDSYDAMTSDRPYAAAMDPDVALAELRRCSGGQFDPAVIAAFCAVHERLKAADERWAPAVGDGARRSDPRRVA